MTYQEARDEAQGKADRLGFDYGVMQNRFLGTYACFMLPQLRNRSGHELRCEVIHPTLLERCKPGHGPMACDPSRIPCCAKHDGGPIRQLWSGA